MDQPQATLVDRQSASRSRDGVRRPSEEALAAARDLSLRVHERAHLPLRRAFAELPDFDLLPEDIARPLPAITPLAQMLRGGRGGSVRLRLYLSMLYLAAAPPHEVTYPARAWAQLLDLENPTTAGTRRVSDAIKWLERNRYVEVVQNVGGPNTVRMMSELGDGRPYRLPGESYNRLRHNFEAASVHRYIRLPGGLWRSGWMAVLSPAALGMLIILYTQLGANRAEDTTVWIAPDYAAETFQLSEETRSRGLNELEAGGLITVRRRALATTEAFSIRRYRNVYNINLDAFDSPAAIPERTPGEARRRTPDFGKYF
ncbi:hypothetical protein [Kribbella sp. CA-247076]|uniref:hypothetical protein n=1 Tax=Kribbella sp. CA-247076 TaxID=3239941 RepID=UPI003D8C701C